MATYKIVLADDHALFREGIKRIIEGIPGVQVMGEVGDGLALRELLKKSVPDLIILDISMPKLQGLEAAQQIKTLYPQVKILALTMHKSKEHLHSAISAGADGYLLKENAYADLILAIEVIQEGNTYISSLVYGHMVDFFRKQRRQWVQRPKVLTSREKRVLALVAEGYSRKEVAEKLSLTISTVQSHRDNIKKKLSMKRTAELIKYAIEEGYTIPGEVSDRHLPG
jgi:DNA-binding NarL/FixJ family response regulator